MNRPFLLALSASILVLACSSRSNSASPPRKCAVDSAALAQVARTGLEKLGLPAANADVVLEVTQRPVRTTGAERLFITVSWGGPSNGAVLWADCSGRVLDGESSGYILTADSVVAGTGRTLLRVRAVTGTGSGWKQESIHLYTSSLNEISLAWSGVVGERSYQAAAVGAYEEDGELTYIGADSLVHSSARFPVAMSSDGAWRRTPERVERTATTYYWVSRAGKYEIHR